MSKLVYVDKDGKPSSEGSADAAFQFHEGDVRLDKFRAAVKARNAKAGKAAPAAEAREADEDGSVERVSKGK